MTPLSALAATKTDTLAPGEQAQAFAYYKALRTCLATGWYKASAGITGRNYFEPKDATAFDWFNGNAGYVTNGVNIGAFNDPRGVDGNGQQNCGDSEGRTWIAKAMALWGYTSSSVPGFLCDELKFTRDSSSVPCTDMTPGADNSFVAPSNAVSNFDTFWKETLGNSSVGIASITPTGGAYRLYLDNFQSQCRPSESGTTYTIRLYDEVSQSWSTKRYGAPDTTRTPGYQVTVWDQQTMSCADLAAKIDSDDDEAVKGYNQWLRDSEGQQDTGTPGGQTVCTLDPTAPGCNSDSTTTCGVEGVGWIVCPVFNFLAGIADTTYGFIEGLLKTSTEILDTSSDNGTYTAWQVMRNVGNVGFVIVFLIIVFSQLTGAGISNYGVKKMLPRLIVAAVLVNLSFFIAQLAVDLSNILGASLRDALELPVFDAFDGGIEQVVGQGNTFTDITTAVLAVQLGAGAVAGAGAAIYFGGIGLLIPIVLAAVVAVIMTLLILIARQAIVILLIVVSPLAFLAMLLPNTENLFKQWRKIFVSMLLLYPAVALLFAGSQLASAIVITSYDDNIGKIIGLAIMVLPLFAVLPILKGSLNAIPAVGGLVQKIANGAISGTRKGGAQATKALGERAAASNNKFAQFASRSLFGRSREGRNRQSSARRAYEEPRIKDIQDKWADDKMLNDADKLAEVVSRKGINSIEGRAAVSRLAQMGETNKLVPIREAAEREGGAAFASYERATRDFFAPLKAKDFRAVLSGPALRSKYDGVKASDMHTMTESAIDAGFDSGSAGFRQTLLEALSDPDQARYFDSKVKAKYAQYVTVGGIGPAPSPAAESTPTPGEGPASSTPPTSTGSGPGGLVVPHDEPDNPFFKRS